MLCFSNAWSDSLILTLLNNNDASSTTSDIFYKTNMINDFRAEAVSRQVHANEIRFGHRAMPSSCHRHHLEMNRQRTRWSGADAHASTRVFLQQHIIKAPSQRISRTRCINTTIRYREHMHHHRTRRRLNRSCYLWRRPATDEMVFGAISACSSSSETRGKVGVACSFRRRFFVWFMKCHPIGRSGGPACNTTFRQGTGIMSCQYAGRRHLTILSNIVRK